MANEAINNVAVRSEMVPRTLACRYPIDTPEDVIAAHLEAWNYRLREYFEGDGFFGCDPEIGVPETEMYSEEDGRVVSCYAYHLYADDQLWAQIARSRTLTVDEPVLARQVRCA